MEKENSIYDLFGILKTDKPFVRKEDMSIEIRTELEEINKKIDSALPRLWNKARKNAEAALNNKEAEG